MQTANPFVCFMKFAATGVAVSLLLLSLLVAAGEGHPFVVVQVLFLSLVIGWVLWLPVAVLSMAPGWWILRGIRRAIRGGGSVNLMGTASASVAVAAVGALGAPVVVGVFQWLLFGPSDGMTGSLAGNQGSAYLLAYAAPGALLAGFAVYHREDRALD